MTLPPWMQMKVDFIDQYNSLGLEWIFHGWIGNGHSTSQISCHGEGAFFTIG